MQGVRERRVLSPLRPPYKDENGGKEAPQGRAGSTRPCGLGEPELPRSGSYDVWARRTPGRGAFTHGIVVRVVADAVLLDASAVRPVPRRIGGHRFGRFVVPPGLVPADSEAIRTAGECWIRLRIV